MMQFLGVAMCLDPKSSQWWILMIFLGKSRGTLKKKSAIFRTWQSLTFFTAWNNPVVPKLSSWISLGIS
jgi:hypothetical protein